MQCGALVVVVLVLVGVVVDLRPRDRHGAGDVRAALRRQVVVRLPIEQVHGEHFDLLGDVLWQFLPSPRSAVLEGLGALLAFRVLQRGEEGVAQFFAVRSCRRAR